MRRPAMRVETFGNDFVVAKGRSKTMYFRFYTDGKAAWSSFIALAFHFETRDFAEDAISKMKRAGRTNGGRK